jgi:hypothetical protein
VTASTRLRLPTRCPDTILPSCRHENAEYYCTAFRTWIQKTRDQLHVAEELRTVIARPPSVASPQTRPGDARNGAARIVSPAMNHS